MLIYKVSLFPIHDSEAEVLEWFKDLEAMQYCKDFVENVSEINCTAI